ncbi:unnamed protein product [Heligmosomoides polygyrus]|uniref:Bravo_FIGEY domain-containing protein n=1 Tax=Heligmosomoides polygyrus TaxID=6339 RepID=A0A183GLZ1_HELPZ|nr:unnamed protein product [Heligmosomoides polygyrus]
MEWDGKEDEWCVSSSFHHYGRFFRLPRAALPRKCRNALALIIRPSKRPPGDEVYNLAELHPGEDETMDDTRDAYISEEDYVYPPGHQPPSQKGNQPPPANYPFREMYD